MAARNNAPVAPPAAVEQEGLISAAPFIRAAFDFANAHGLIHNGGVNESADDEKNGGGDAETGEIVAASVDDPPLLAFVKSQASCLKGSPEEFHDWLLSEDIITLSDLAEAVSDCDYL